MSTDPPARLDHGRTERARGHVHKQAPPSHAGEALLDAVVAHNRHAPPPRGLLAGVMERGARRCERGTVDTGATDLHRGKGGINADARCIPRNRPWK